MQKSKTPLDRLCETVDLSVLSEIDKVEILIWFAMRLYDRPAAYLPQISDMLVEAHFSRPNLSRLVKTLQRRRTILSREAQSGKHHFSLSRPRLLELDSAYGAAVFGSASDAVLDTATEALREQISSSPNQQLRRFLGEAVGCLEANHMRAAVVLTWSGAVEYLCDYIFSNKLSTFNHHAISRQYIKKPISTRVSGFDKMSESEIVQVAEDIGIFGKSVKKAVLGCLDRRNACGHPNDYRVGPQQVRSDIEFLMSHVFSL